MKYFLLFAILSLLFSCKTGNKTQMCDLPINKNIQFKTIEELENYVFSKNNCEYMINEIYIINKRISNRNLATLLLNEPSNRIISIKTVSSKVVFGYPTKTDELVIIIETCTNEQ